MSDHTDKEDYITAGEDAESEASQQDSEALAVEPTMPARVKDVLPGIIHLLPVAARPFFPGRRASAAGPCKRE